MPTFAVQSHRGVEQLVARRAHNPEAGGSSPSPATKFNGHREIDVRFLFGNDILLDVHLQSRETRNKSRHPFPKRGVCFF